MASVTMRPHVLGIDDGPFDKRQKRPVRVVAVLMEGNNLVEGMALGELPVDGPDATGFLAEWIKTMRWKAAAFETASRYLLLPFRSLATGTSWEPK